MENQNQVINDNQRTSVGCCGWVLRVILCLFGLAVVFLGIGFAIIGAQDLYIWYENEYRIFADLTERIQKCCKNSKSEAAQATKYIPRRPKQKFGH